MKPVKTKMQNYQLWRAGAYGNKLRAWRSVAAWRASGFPGRVVLRYLGREGGGHCTYGLVMGAVDAEVARWLAEGLEPEKMMLNEMADKSTPVIQGEYYAGVLGTPNGPLVNPFLFSRLPSPMRSALAGGPQNASGLRARLLLRHFMTTASYEDFRALADTYPDHVLEVSVFDRCLGDLPRRNAVVWEVRQY